jgi:hypothetical protein
VQSGEEGRGSQRGAAHLVRITNPGGLSCFRALQSCEVLQRIVWSKCLYCEVIDEG